MTSRETLFKEFTKKLNINFEPNIRAGANYEVAVQHENQIYISGQIPRVQGEIVVMGRVGDDLSVDQARRAAQICVLRAIAILKQSLGNLDRVQKILRMTVYVQSAHDFIEQSEVADAASEILYALFAPNGAHTRTSVGVYQLPKNAPVEIDLIAAVDR
jgi:enamine deaminase RidA (YjgF/YER057c/UK114 family)